MESGEGNPFIGWGKKAKVYSAIGSAILGAASLGAFGGWYFARRDINKLLQIQEETVASVEDLNRRVNNAGKVDKELVAAIEDLNSRQFKTEFLVRTLEGS